MSGIRTRKSRQGHCTRRRQFAYTIVDVVTNSVGIDVRNAIAAANVEGVELVALAVTVASRDV